MLYVFIIRRNSMLCEKFPIHTWPARDPRHKPSSSERTFFPCVGTYVVGECDDEQATASKSTNKMYVQKIWNISLALRQRKHCRETYIVWTHEINPLPGLRGKFPLGTTAPTLDVYRLKRWIASFLVRTEMKIRYESLRLEHTCLTM